MVLDTDLRFIFANKAYLEATHRTDKDIKGHYVFDVFPDEKDRIDHLLSEFEATLNGRVTQLKALPYQLKMEDGSLQDRVWQATQDPLRDETGTIIGLIQRCEDITHQHHLEQRNKAISHELSHRIKNSMAVISALARITSRNADNIDDYVESFTRRIDAITRANELLLDNDWRGLRIDQIFKAELKPYEDEGQDAYSLDGPPVRLTIDASKNLSMVLHELTTNAVKYGCLKGTGGHLTVRWVQDADKLTINWQESCSHNITPPDNVGFGTRLFNMLPSIAVERDFTPTGLHLTITMDGEILFA